jgi:hypothetical protein
MAHRSKAKRELAELAKRLDFTVANTRLRHLRCHTSGGVVHVAPAGASATIRTQRAIECRLRRAAAGAAP